MRFAPVALVALGLWIRPSAVHPQSRPDYSGESLWGAAPTTDGQDDGFRMDAKTGTCQRSDGTLGRNRRYLGECGDFGAVRWIGAGLSDKPLQGINLEGAFLGEAKLGYARLQGANLAGIQAARISLYGANLRGAHLEEAYLFMADLRKATLQGARLENADLEKTDLRGADLSGVDLSTCRLVGARFGPATRMSLSKEKAVKRGMIYEPLFSPARLLPIDQSAEDLSFLIFKKELLERIQRRDSGYLRKVMDPEIHFSFGPEGSGADRLLAQFDAKAKNEGDKLWEELQKTITLGCVLTQSTSTFVCPYVIERWPINNEEDSVSSFYAVVVAGAELHKEPRSGSEILRRFEFDILKEISDESGAIETGWRRVTDSEGMEGYVRHEHVRSPIDYRAAFRFEGGRWKLVLFIAGD